jgi:hypothetical protein
MAWEMRFSVSIPIDLVSKSLFIGVSHPSSGQTCSLDPKSRLERMNAIGTALITRPWGSAHHVCVGGALRATKMEEMREEKKNNNW